MVDPDIDTQKFRFLIVWFLGVPPKPKPKKPKIQTQTHNTKNLGPKPKNSKFFGFKKFLN
jgi:hypothetical protein